MMLDAGEEGSGGWGAGVKGEAGAALLCHTCNTHTCNTILPTAVWCSCCRSRHKWEIDCLMLCAALAATAGMWGCGACLPDPR